MTPRPKRVTLADVAKEAGVSVQAASHVLAGTRDVRIAEATREKIREAARTVGYRPNRFAQAMRNGRADLIGVWMPVDRESPLLQRFLRSISNLCRNAGYEILITGLDSEMAYRGEGRPPTSWPVEGVLGIDAGKALIRFREDPGNDHIPIVVFGMEQLPNGDAVSWDLMKGAQEATRRMIASGARHPIHLTYDWIETGYPNEQRRRGFAVAVQEAGLEPVLVPVAGEASCDAESAIASYLETGNRVDAVFANNDTMAAGAARAIMAKGLSIPGDCQICGYGDFSEASGFSVPITTLAVPFEALVQQAWTWLNERIADPSLPSRLCLLDLELIERASTRNHPA